MKALAAHLHINCPQIAPPGIIPTLYDHEIGKDTKQLVIINATIMVRVDLRNVYKVTYTHTPGTL